MRDQTRSVLYRLAALIGIAWATFHVFGLIFTGPLLLAVSALISSNSPLYGAAQLAIWCTVGGIFVGLVAAYLTRSPQPRMPAALVGAMAALVAFGGYRFSASPAGPRGEQGIRIVFSGVSSALAFSLASRRDRNVAR